MKRDSQGKLKNNSSQQFIVRMKLRELRRQRERLCDVYDAISAQLAKAPNSRDRLIVLYEGLKRVTFANQRLHSDVGNLEILLAAGPGRSSGKKYSIYDETVELWLKKLTAELEAGRLRSEFAFIFGGLLEEWFREQKFSGDEQGDRTELNDELHTAWISKLSKTVTLDWSALTGVLDTLFDEVPHRWKVCREEIERCTDPKKVPVVDKGDLMSEEFFKFKSVYQRINVDEFMFSLRNTGT